MVLPAHISPADRKGQAQIIEGLEQSWDARAPTVPHEDATPR